MTEKKAVLLTDTMYERGVVSQGHLPRLEDIKSRTYSKDRPLVYGAIGGSITAGASAQPGQAYAPLFAEYLKQHYPVTFINAGIGASNSLFGAFRVQKDLLVHKPDIVTIEYAVNDVNNPDIALAYESLVRQCLLCDSQPLVILLFTMRRDGSNTQDIHATVGKHYDFAMLSYRDAVYPEITAGQFTWEDISPDEVHPNDDGHRMIFEMLRRYFEMKPSPTTHKLEWLRSMLDKRVARYMDGRIIDASQMNVVSNDGWTTGPHKGGYTGFNADQPGAELVVTFKGRLAYLGYKKFAGDFGQVSVELDGKDMGIFDGFYEKPVIQAWAGGHTVIDPLDLAMRDKQHTLKIRLLKSTHPESHGHQFDLGYLLVS